MKKIYFAGSISGGRGDSEIYSEILKCLQEYGEVLTEHVGNNTVSNLGENNTDEYIYNRDLAWLKSADVIVAEVSTPSLGVGFEISKAISLGKKILCLCRIQADKRLSAMISGCPDVLVEKYNTLEEAKNSIGNFLKD